MAPVTRIDFLDLFAPELKDDKGVPQHLSGRYSVRDPKNNRVFCVKNPNGFPIDVLNYQHMDGDDDEYVYDQFTEGDPPEGWKDPHKIKMHNANNNRGTKIMRRWINYPFTAPIVVEDQYSPFQVLANGVWDGVLHTIRATRRTLFPPITKTWPGSVGSIPTWLLQYEYNGRLVPGTTGIQYTAREDLQLGYDPTTKRALGLLQWALNAKGADGKYSKVNENTASTSLKYFKDNTDVDDKIAQNARLVRLPYLGIDGVI